MSGIVKGNWNLVHAASAASSKDTSVYSFLDIPWKCAARIGGLTALIYYLMNDRGNPEQDIAIAGWLAGLSDILVPKKKQV